MMTPEQRKAIGLFYFDELEAHNKKSTGSYVIEGLLQEGSLNIAVGDSGEGKTPLAYQMALCVCNGVPFLGRQVAKGPAIYIDLENSGRDVEALVLSLSRHLNCPKPVAPNFATVLECAPRLLPQMIVEVKPKLIIIDSLRAFNPDAEKTEKVGAILNELRKYARNYNAAILFIHHIRKPKEDAEPTPPGQSVIEMLNRACGARALINQTDTRILFPSEGKPEGAALVMWWNTRLHGQFGPTFIERCLDDGGEPLGYRKLAGAALLSNQHQAAYRCLPPEFSFKDAKFLYKRGDQATSNLLRKCKEVGILEQSGKGGRYRKIEPEGGEYQPPAMASALDGVGKADPTEE